MSEKLLELAARCEAASGPDRELDAEIAAVVHLKQLTYQPGEWIKDPEFTASFDAAMALVPEGGGICLNIAQGPWVGHLVRIWEVSAELACEGKDACAWEVAVNGQTLPLALCAAALRALASQQPTIGGE